MILLDNGLNVVDFLMNDKCAAGTGRFIEVMMRILEEDLASIDEFVVGKHPGQHLQHVHRLRRERDCQPAGHRS